MGESSETPFEGGRQGGQTARAAKDTDSWWCPDFNFSARENWNTLSGSFIQGTPKFNLPIGKFGP